MAETLKRQHLWEGQDVQRSQVCNELRKEFDEDAFFFCFFPIKLTHFALCIET